MNLSRFPKKKAVESYPPPPPPDSPRRGGAVVAAFRFGPLALALLVLGLLLLLAVAAPVGAQTTDYDDDDDGLIDLRTAAQLNAVRHDLNGNGDATHADYVSAFTNRQTGSTNRMGCPSGTCTGYELRADLDLSTDYPAWTPLGVYTATFDGQGHTISGMAVSVSADTTEAGLFNETSSSAVIRDLGLISPSVTLTSTTTSGAGALVGLLAGNSTVSAVYVSGGTITAAGNDVRAGGLVGIVANGSTVQASYSTATVTTSGGSRNSIRMGGLVGGNSGTLRASYASGTVNPTSTSANVGGLVGRSFGGGHAITDSHCSAATGQTNCIGSQSGNTVTSTRYTAAQLQAPVGYTGIYANWNIDVDGVSGNDEPWNFGTSSQAPTLWKPSERVAQDYDADDNGLIDIATAAQLSVITHDLNGNGDATHGDYIGAFHHRQTGATNRMGCPSGTCTGYELTADVTLTAAWTPTGTYTATFDGGGHSVSGLSVSNAGDSGMFGGLGGSAIVRDLRLISPSITENAGGSSSSGALVGYIATGTTVLISAVSIEGGSVTTTIASSNVGGIVGYMLSGQIKASWTSATVGISSNPATVDAGGLVGDLGGGSIIASYSRGTADAASSGSNSGPFAGQVSSSSAVITNSYCVAASFACDGVVASGGPSASRYTTAQMQAPTGYAGIFLNWNIDLDSDSDLDWPWQFGTASDYPTLNTPAQRATATPADTDFDATDKRPHRHQHGGAIERRPVGLERRRRPGRRQQQRLRHGLWRPPAHRRRRRRADGLPPHRLHRLRTHRRHQPGGLRQLDAHRHLHGHFRRQRERRYQPHHRLAGHRLRRRRGRAVQPAEQRRQHPAGRRHRGAGLRRRRQRPGNGHPGGRKQRHYPLQLHQRAHRRRRQRRQP